MLLDAKATRLIKMNVPFTIQTKPFWFKANLLKTYNVKWYLLFKENI